MIDHISLGVSDFLLSLAFYQAALAPLGRHANGPSQTEIPTLDYSITHSRQLKYRLIEAEFKACQRTDVRDQAHEAGGGLEGPGLASLNESVNGPRQLAHASEDLVVVDGRIVEREHPAIAAQVAAARGFHRGAEERLHDDGHFDWHSGNLAESEAEVQRRVADRDVAPVNHAGQA